MIGIIIISQSSFIMSFDFIRSTSFDFIVQTTILETIFKSMNYREIKNFIRLNRNVYTVFSTSAVLTTMLKKRNKKLYFDGPIDSLVRGESDPNQYDDGIPVFFGVFADGYMNFSLLRTFIEAGVDINLQIRRDSEQYLDRGDTILHWCVGLDPYAVKEQMIRMILNAGYDLSLRNARVPILICQKTKKKHSQAKI